MKQPATSKSKLLAAPLLATGVFLLSSNAMPEDGVGELVDNARAALEKWVETRHIISKEKRDWALGKEMLDDRIELTQQGIDDLRDKIEDAEASIAEADEKREELLTENEKFKEASMALAGSIGGLEERTKDLLKRLPDPIRDRVKALSQQLPANPDETELSLSQRFMHLVGILNEVNKFNREITMTSEVRDLQDGTTAEVTALYIGIGQAYYATSKGDAAGVGTASPEGWTWTPANDAADEVAAAIAILKDEQVADFVLLPVRID